MHRKGETEVIELAMNYELIDPLPVSIQVETPRQNCT